jgi:hypothetical protein
MHHSQRHINSQPIGAQSPLDEDTDTTFNGANGDGNGENKSFQDSMLVSPSSEWAMVSSEKTFVPGSEDVGCRLKIEVSAFSTDTNALLAGPVTVYTEPVLSAPSPPPKRRLLAISGAVAGLSGALRFRLISYNILAEQFATKQVLLSTDL